MIHQGSGDLDLAAVAADDALLDLLAARAEVPADDVLAGMLAAFVGEVDEGLAELLAPDAAAVALPAAVPAMSVVPALAPRSVRRSHGLRATTIALVVGATLSVSGVAAAVTGDPFAPYRGIVSAVTGDDESAAQAARVAWLQRQLAGTRAKVAHGDLAGATADLSAMRDRLAGTKDLSHGQRTSLEARIAALEAALARAAVAQQHGKGNASPVTDPSTTPGPQGATSHEPQGGGVGQPDSTKTPEPQNTKKAEPAPTQTTELPAPDPQNTKAHPQATRTPGPQNTKAHPRASRPARPQSTKKAEPQVSTTASPVVTERPGNGNGNANGQAKR
jgi:hypothetical protein